MKTILYVAVSIVVLAASILILKPQSEKTEQIERPQTTVQTHDTEKPPSLNPEPSDEAAWPTSSARKHTTSETPARTSRHQDSEKSEFNPFETPDDGKPFESFEGEDPSQLWSWPEQEDGQEFPVPSASEEEEWGKPFAGFPADSWPNDTLENRELGSEGWNGGSGSEAE